MLQPPPIRNCASCLPVLPSYACTVQTRHESYECATCASSTGKSGFSTGAPMKACSIGPWFSLPSRGPMFHAVGVITW